MEEAGNTMSGDEQNLEALLGDTEWLHSLARTLVRDSCMADDLVQDTCVAVLSRYNGGPVPGVAWFRRVLRNFVYLRRREDANRRRRERAAAGIAGFDPDGADWSLFRAYKAGVGSASLYILNPRGEVVWVMQDPRTQDFAFAKRLLLRAAGR